MLKWSVSYSTELICKYRAARATVYQPCCCYCFCFALYIVVAPCSMLTLFVYPFCRNWSRNFGSFILVLGGDLWVFTSLIMMYDFR
jgi:hypothetical protein